MSSWASCPHILLRTTVTRTACRPSWGLGCQSGCQNKFNEFKPVQLVVESGHAQCLRLLLNHAVRAAGSDVRLRWHLLRAAAPQKSAACLRLLLDAGLNPTDGGLGAPADTDE